MSGSVVVYPIDSLEASTPWDSDHSIKQNPEPQDCGGKDTRHEHTDSEDADQVALSGIIAQSEGSNLAGNPSHSNHY